jgi:hypothetical protein
MRTLISALAVLTLSATGCKQTSDRYDRDNPPSAQKQVEQAQEESAQAYDRAKVAQEKAADEAREAARAQDKVSDKRQELSEAEQKAMKSQQEAQAAQEQAEREGEAAHSEAQQAQARAAQAQQQAAQEVEITSVPERVGMAPVTPSHDTSSTMIAVRRLQTAIDMAIDRIKNNLGGPSADRNDRLDVDDTAAEQRARKVGDDIARPINPVK